MTFEEFWRDVPFGRETLKIRGAAELLWERAQESMRERAAQVCEDTMGCENDTDYSHMPEGHYDLARKLRALPVE